MHFLKKKAISVYQYSRQLIKKPVKIAQMNGTELLCNIINHFHQECDAFSMQRLAFISSEFHEYTQIFNILIDRLEGFAYTPKAIQQTLKLLNLVVYLIKTGSEEFAKDFKKNEDLIVSMERVDTHRYENCIGLKDAKTLTYKLELIRHRATYIRRLINNSELREEERLKSMLPSSVLDEFKGKAGGDETINGLKIDASFDKSPAKPAIRSKQNKRKEEKSQEFSSKMVTLPRPSQALGNKISNQICT